MAHGKAPFERGVIFRILVCGLLGAALVLFIRNNQLLARGADNLYHLESLIMLGVLGLPFLFAVFHLIRSLRRDEEET